MREYAKANDIVESSYGVFEKDGEDALAMLLNIATSIVINNQNYMNYLDVLELDVDGKKENCITSIKKWLKNKGRLNKEIANNEEIN